MAKNQSLEEKINLAIKNDLPNQVGKELVKKLEQADLDAVELVLVKSQLADSVLEVKALETRVRNQSEELKQHANLTTRENSIAEKERNAKIAELTYQLESEKDKTKHSRDVTMSLTRNTEFRRDVFRDKGFDNPSYYENGNIKDNGGPRSENENITDRVE